MLYKKFCFGLLIVILSAGAGCNKAYWFADPMWERVELALTKKITVETQPTGARVVIATLRNPQVYSGFAPVKLKYRIHPYQTSWILVAKQGYKTQAFRIKNEDPVVDLRVVLAERDPNEEDMSLEKILSGGPGQPYGTRDRGNMNFMRGMF